MTAMVTAPLVLVVDDEPEVREMISEILGGEGYRTRAVESGMTALEIARSERLALVILDLFLVDLDGYTVATRLRALPAIAQTPILFITGSDVPSHQARLLGLGGVSHLPKPFTAAQLLRAVGQALRGPEG